MKKRKYIHIIFLSITTILIIYCITFFMFRQGHHNDETASYFYANGKTTESMMYWYNDEADKWTDGSSIRNGLQVQTDERFDFSNTWKNQEYDMSPPLHSLILHAICSLFPDTFSWAYAFIINLVSMAIALFVLYQIGLILTASKLKSFILVCFYGLSAGAISNAIYLRMYAMLAMFFILLVWLNFRIQQKELQIQKCLPELAGIFAIIYLSGLTHYYAFFFSLFMSIGMFLGMLFGRKWKIGALYFFTVSLAIAGALYTFQGWRHMFSGSGSETNAEAVKQVTMSYSWSVWMCFKHTLKYLTGLNLLTVYGWTVFFSIVLIILILGLSYFFLFRKSNKILKAKEKARGFMINTGAALNPRNFTIHWVLLSCAIGIVGSFLLVGKISDFIGMGEYGSRYLFPFMIVAALLGFVWIEQIISLLFHKRYISTWLLAGLCIVCVVGSLITRGSAFFFPENKTEPVDVESITSGQDVLYLNRNTSNIYTNCTYFLNCNRFFNSNIDTMNEDVLETLADYQNSGHTLYLLLDTSVYQDIPQDIGISEEIRKKFKKTWTEQEIQEIVKGIDSVTQYQSIVTFDTFTGTLQLIQLN